MKNKDLEDLSALYSLLKTEKIPPFSGNDELDDWVESLIEIDAILAGLACSLLAGEKLTSSQVSDIEDLEVDFLKIQTKEKLDKNLFLYINYLRLLQDVYWKILKIIKN